MEEGNNIVKCELVVKQVGDSLYLLLDSNIRNRLNVDKGTILGAKLWNIEVESIKCPHCEYVFEDYMNKDPHDCPSCGEEFLDCAIISNKEKMKGGIEK